MRAGSRCEKGWGTGFERSLITKERENAEEKKIRDETGQLLQIARNDNMSSSLKKLKEFSGGGKYFGNL